MANTFLELIQEFTKKGTKFDHFKIDNFIDAVRYQDMVLGSVFSKPYVVEFYLNGKLYARIPSLSYAETDLLLKLGHQKINNFGSDYCQMVEFLNQFYEINKLASSWIEQYKNT